MFGGRIIKIGNLLSKAFLLRLAPLANLKLLTNDTLDCDFRHEEDGIQDAPMAREMFLLLRLQDADRNEVFHSPWARYLLCRVLRGQVRYTLCEMPKGGTLYKATLRNTFTNLYFHWRWSQPVALPTRMTHGIASASRALTVRFHWRDNALLVATRNHTVPIASVNCSPSAAQLAPSPSPVNPRESIPKQDIVNSTTFQIVLGIGGTRFISFEDRHWHNDCFICGLCKSSLVGRGFITDEEEDIICPDCAKAKLMAS